ncbi:hypothetical protein GEMRC1_003774 [Eukaryota sp. GEM-RC1]
MYLSNTRGETLQYSVIRSTLFVRILSPSRDSIEFFNLIGYSIDTFITKYSSELQSLVTESLSTNPVVSDDVMRVGEQFMVLGFLICYQDKNKVWPTLYNKFIAKVKQKIAVPLNIDVQNCLLGLIARVSSVNNEFVADVAIKIIDKLLISFPKLKPVEVLRNFGIFSSYLIGFIEQEPFVAEFEPLNFDSEESEQANITFFYASSTFISRYLLFLEVLPLSQLSSSGKKSLEVIADLFCRLSNTVIIPLLDFYPSLKSCIVQYFKNLALCSMQGSFTIDKLFNYFTESLKHFDTNFRTTDPSFLSPVFSLLTENIEKFTPQCKIKLKFEFPTVFDSISTTVTPSLTSRIENSSNETNTRAIRTDSKKEKPKDYSELDIFDHILKLPPTAFFNTSSVTSLREFPSRPAPPRFDSDDAYTDFFAPLIEVEMFYSIAAILESQGFERRKLVTLQDRISKPSYFTLTVTDPDRRSLQSSLLEFDSDSAKFTLKTSDLVLFGDVEELERFSTEGEAYSGDAVFLGIVKIQEKRKISIVFRNISKLSSFLVSGSTFGVVLLDSVATYAREWDSVSKIRNISEIFKNSLIRGRASPLQIPSPSSELRPIPRTGLRLNQSQKQSLLNILATSSGFYLLQGPPGTGKTTCLVTLIDILIQRNKKILICAPSNQACNEIMTRCLDFTHLKPLIARVTSQTLNDDLEPYTLDSLKEKSLEVSRTALIQRHPIIFSTLGSTASLSFSEISEYFDFLIIDEATQCTETTNILPLRLLKRSSVVVLCGDHQQLAATVLSKARALEQSLFERILPLHQESNRFSCLIEQYRMHQDIVQFPSKEFYNNALLTNYQISSDLKRVFAAMRSSFRHFAVYSHNGSEFLGRNHSYANDVECNELIKLLSCFITVLEANLNDFGIDDRSFTLLIICFYKGQKSLITRKLSAISSKPFLNITVTTADSAQGSEADFVFCSPVRSNSSNIGFLKDDKRLNVAITRAKHFLFIVANTGALGESRSTWSKLIGYAREKGVCLDFDSVHGQKTRRGHQGSAKEVGNEGKSSICRFYRWRIYLHWFVLVNSGFSLGFLTDIRIYLNAKQCLVSPSVQYLILGRCIVEFSLGQVSD